MTTLVERSGDLKLCSLSPRVRQVLAMAGLDLVLELWEPRDRALAAFGGSPDRPGRPCPSG